MASSIQFDDDLEPCNQWVIDTAKELGFTFEYPISIDEQRYNAASSSLLYAFYDQHNEIIKNCPQQLLQGADETMMCSLIREKVIGKVGSKSLVSEIDLPHITCMCTHKG